MEGFDEDSKASLKKSFPGRTDNQVKTESSTPKEHETGGEVPAPPPASTRYLWETADPDQPAFLA